MDLSHACERGKITKDGKPIFYEFNNVVLL
jgi:hypothetical protein